MRSRSLALLHVLGALVLQCATDGRSQLGSPCDYEVCMGNYSMVEFHLPYLNNTVRCPILLDTYSCLEGIPCTDTDINAIFRKEDIKLSIERYSCQPQPSPTHSPGLTPTPSPTTTPLPDCPSYLDPPTLPCDSALGDCCPRLPAVSDKCDVVWGVETSELAPLSPPDECVVPEDDRISLQHCSMFTYSHVRPFGAYDRGVQTCQLPGSWYLVKHPGFSVEVTTSSQSVGSVHTLLSKVNVTFINHSCSPGASYVAEAATPLLHSFSRGQASSSVLQLMVNDNATLATIRASWLNTTILIRRHSHHLSVTLQVPAKFILTSQGLCSGGCPAHTVLDAQEYVKEHALQCARDNNRATYLCYAAGVFNQDYSAFYAKKCVFDTLKAGSLEALSMMNATVRDALLLPDVGSVPSLEVPIDLSPTVPPEHPTTEVPERTTAHTTDLPELVSAPPASSQSLLSLSTLALLPLTLLAAAILR